METIRRKVFTVAAMLAMATAVAAAGKTPDPIVDSPLTTVKGEQTVVLAGGCFWGLQAVFEHVRGVTAVAAGYSGGSAATANYDAVSDGSTGHAEAVRITYDPSQITYGQLLKVFFFVAHDPTELNRQGPDTGTQYRSVIFYSNAEQHRIAQAYINQLNEGEVLSDPLSLRLSAFACST